MATTSMAALTKATAFVWFVPGCAGPREVSEPAQQVAAPDRPIENSIEGVLPKLFC